MSDVDRRAPKPRRMASAADDYRIYLVVKYVCYLGIPAHASFVFLFFTLEVPLLGYYNIFSTLVWVAASTLNRRGRHQLAIDLITIEVVGFAAFGVYSLGWGSGFQTYIMPLIAFVMLNHRLRTLTTVGLGVTLVAIYILLFQFSQDRQFDVVAPWIIDVLHYVNIGVVFAGLCIVSYYFRAASINAERRMEQLATTDPLTGLSNRSKMWEALGDAQLRAEHDRVPFVIALADIDHFKTINDTYGHDGGDTALRQIAELLRVALRQNDLVCRWGGEEFLMLLPDTPAEAGLAVTERVRAAIAGADIRFTGIRLPVTITIGVAQLDSGERVDRCIRRADTALYRGKQEGRNRVIPADQAEQLPVERPGLRAS